MKIHKGRQYIVTVNTAYIRYLYETQAGEKKPVAQILQGVLQDIDYFIEGKCKWITQYIMPDGSLYRIYSTTDRFFSWWTERGETFLRIRQATELGYTDCPCPGAADLSYPSSALRRSRTVGGVSS